MYWDVEGGTGRQQASQGDDDNGQPSLHGDQAAAGSHEGGARPGGTVLESGESGSHAGVELPAGEDDSDPPGLADGDASGAEGREDGGCCNGADTTERSEALLLHPVRCGVRLQIRKEQDVLTDEVTSRLTVSVAVPLLAFQVSGSSNSTADT